MGACVHASEAGTDRSLSFPCPAGAGSHPLPPQNSVQLLSNPAASPLPPPQCPPGSMPVSSPAQSRCSEHPASLCHQSSPLSAPGAPEAITRFEFHGQVDARRCAERFTEMNLCSHVCEASAVKIPISQMRTRAQRGAGSCPRPHSRGEELSWKPAPSDLLFAVSFLSLCWVGGGTEDPHLPSLRLSTHPFPQGWFSPSPFISVPGEVRAGLARRR